MAEYEEKGLHYHCHQKMHQVCLVYWTKSPVPVMALVEEMVVVEGACGESGAYGANGECEEFEENGANEACVENVVLVQLEKLIFREMIHPMRMKLHEGL